MKKILINILASALFALIFTFMMGVGVAFVAWDISSVLESFGFLRFIFLMAFGIALIGAKKT